MSVERSVSCAKGSGGCRRLWAGQSPASGNVTPAVLGRMDGGVRGKELSGHSSWQGPAGQGLWVPMLRSQEERPPTLSPQVAQS